MAFFVQLELTSNCARVATIRVWLLFPVFATETSRCNLDDLGADASGSDPVGAATLSF